MSATRIVKRYANRKLYDTERSCYVTLEDIALMIKEGAQVKVIDNKSGEDLTTVTLAQIIFETEKKKGFMPLDLLRSLIQQSSNSGQQLSQEALNQLQSKAAPAQSSGDAVDAQEQSQDTGAEVQPLGINELLGAAKASYEQLQTVVAAKINGPDGSTARNASLGRDMEEIRRRLGDLSERLAHLVD